MNTETLESESNVIEAESEVAASGGSAVKCWRIYLAAWMAAEKALPKDSLQLIEAHDELHSQWCDAGWPNPTPPELVAASKAIESDPFASIAFDLRQKTNTAASMVANSPNDKTGR
jgi:hypothetical protein